MVHYGFADTRRLKTTHDSGDSDIGLIFNIDIQMALPVSYCLFRRSA